MALQKTAAEIKKDNECFVAAIADPAHRKVAADMAADYTARQIREGGFSRHIMEPMSIADTDLNRWPQDDKLSVTFDMEPGIMAYAAVPFNGTPIDIELQCDRYVVTGNRVMSVRASFDEEQLRTYRYDVKEVFATNMIRDCMAIEDIYNIYAVQQLLGGAVDSVTLPGSNMIQWRTISGGISRDGIVEGLSQPYRTRYRIPGTTVLTNIYTLDQFNKWGRDEAGGDLAESAIINGYLVKSKMFKRDWIGTIKQDLVPDFRLHHFGPRKTLGQSIMFTPAQMHIEQKGWTYSFFTAYVIGTVYAHPGALFITDHTA